MRPRHRFLALTLALVGPLPAAEAAAAVPTCDGRTATIVGTPGPDRLTGTSRADVIVGLGGRDMIDGRGGKDRLCGGDGMDRLHGGSGDDRVLGQGDACLGEAPCAHYGDVLSGGMGNDAIVGGGDRGSDWVRFANSRRGVVVDLAAGTSSGQGNDALFGVDQAVTTPYDDEVSGLQGDSYVLARGGDDTVREADPEWIGVALTGPGDDLVTVAGPGTVSAGPGDDAVEANGPGGETFTADGNDVVLLGASGHADVGSGDDVVEGSDLDDSIRSGPGNDRIRANDGDDFVRDGAGEDTLEGGEGDDAIHGRRGTDTFDGGPGFDLISYIYLVGDVGVVLDLTAGTAVGVGGADSLTGFENATGSPQDDAITGDDGPNLLAGFSGDDTLVGGAGHDGGDGGQGIDACDTETRVACEQ